MNVREGGSGGAGLILWLGVLVLAAGVAVLATLMIVKRRAPVPPHEEKAVAVRVLEVVPRRLADRLRLPGRVRPWREAVLGVEQEGVIARREVDQGDAVSSNDVLLATDTRLYEAALRQVGIEEADAVRDLGRLHGLAASGAVAAAELDAAASRLSRAEVMRLQAQTRLDQCTVRAPFEGRVDARWIEAGEFAARGKAAFHLVDLSRVKVRFAVPERDVLCVSPGETVAFTVAADPGTVHTGRVSFVQAVADPASNTFDVDLDAPNAEGRLRAGMIAEVRLVRRVLDDALIVPLAAVVPRKGEQVVYLAREGRAVRRVVQMGAMQDDEVVLTSGVGPGERLIIEGQRVLQDGARIEVCEDAGAAGREP